MKNWNYSSKDEQSSDLKFSRIYKALFDGRLSNSSESEDKFKFLEGSKLYYSHPFPIWKIYKDTLKIEFNRLLNIGVNKLYNLKKLQVESSQLYNNEIILEH